MHWIVPFAAPLSEAGRHALHTLKLPQLDALLARSVQGERDDGDALSLSPPHERALARALGLAGADGELPWGAFLAGRDDIDTGDLAWGLLTPVHWEVGADHVRLTDPAALALDDAASRTFFEALRPLFESEGLALVYGAPERWYVAHESLKHLATASPDRVIGRHLDTWLPGAPEARLLRRLQNESQMLLYTHPLNAEREAAGALPLNSFWLSGCGVRQHTAPAPAGLRINQRLRRAALSEDWAAWAEGWQALDAELGQALRSGQPLTLVLCGERSGVRFDTRTPSLWQRVRATLQAPSSIALLESL
jgi:hypothetical protein